MKKGMLIKIGEDLFRVLELQHVTPGNLRGVVRVGLQVVRRLPRVRRGHRGHGVGVPEEDLPDQAPPVHGSRRFRRYTRQAHGPPP